MRCKGNYVADVKQNVPQGPVGRLFLYSLSPLSEPNRHKLQLDNDMIYGIIKLSCVRGLQAGFSDRRRRTQTIKERSLARRRCAQFTSRTSSGPQVSAKRVLRPARSGSSQIRDASSRLGGKCFGHGCREGLWDLSANVLSSQGEPGRSWPGRVGSEKAWTARSAQTPRRCDQVSQAAGASGPTHSSSSACGISSRPLRRAGPSTDDRTGPSGKKNGRLSYREAVGAFCESTTVFERYERVRRIGADEMAESQYRDGLVLLVRQGMLRWARAVDGCEATDPYHANPVDALAVPAQRMIVIHLLAQVAMATRKGRFQ